MVELIVAENYFGDTRSGGLAGPTGLVIILMMIIGTVLLIRNMNKRLRRLPSSFSEPKPSTKDSESVEGDTTP